MDDAHLLDEGFLLLEVETTLDVTLDGYAYKSEVEFLEGRGWEIWQADWNDHYSWLAKTVPVTAYLEVRCSEQDKQVAAVNVVSLVFGEG